MLTLANLPFSWQDIDQIIAQIVPRLVRNPASLACLLIGLHLHE